MRNSYKFVYRLSFIVYRWPKAVLRRLSTVDYRLSTRNGQSLIEVVVSAGIVVILMVALISTSLIVQKSARSAKNNTVATKLAQETIENLRVYRDRKTFESLTVDDNLILRKNAADPLDVGNWDLIHGGVENITRTSGATFVRTISIKQQPQDTNNKLVTVTLTWNESGGQKTVSSQTILSSWEE